MLFKQHHLEGIKAGDITLAFRKWKRPAVKPGSLLKTAVGQVEIHDISEIRMDEITDSDALQAGFQSLNELNQLLKKVPDGVLYRIELSYHSPDPRIALRSQTKLSEFAYEEIKTKLDRLDRYSKTGNWTHGTLEAIKENPKLKAADLALLLGKEKEWLKLNIRKLKNLGLTISHQPGYEISPLGEEFLRMTSGSDQALPKH